MSDRGFISFDRKSIPNLLTAMRVVLVAMLWIPALMGEAVVVGVGLAVAGLTDTADGILARRLHAASSLGSRYDSIADHLLFASVLGWLVLLRPAFIQEQATLLLIWIGIGLVSLVVGWLRFGRFADLHLYSAKVAVVLGIIFAVHALVFDEYSRGFFRLAIAVAILAATEMLLVQITRDRIDERIGSILSDCFGRERRGR